MFYVP
jgi:structural maintenance of chromosome 2